MAIIDVSFALAACENIRLKKEAERKAQSEGNNEIRKGSVREQSILQEK